MEPQVKFNDQLFTDPESDLGSLVLNHPSLSIEDYNKTFTDSPQRAFEWISASLKNHKQTNAAIVGPAGTGKSYLLNALIEFMWSRGLVVAKLVPSGVAAHLIGGQTIHHFILLTLNATPHWSMAPHRPPAPQDRCPCN